MSLITIAAPPEAHAFLRSISEITPRTLADNSTPLLRKWLGDEMWIVAFGLSLDLTTLHVDGDHAAVYADIVVIDDFDAGCRRGRKIVLAASDICSTSKTHRIVFVDEIGEPTVDIETVLLDKDEQYIASIVAAQAA